MGKIGYSGSIFTIHITPTVMKMAKKITLTSYLYVLILALCWSPSFMFIKIAVQEIPPITLAFCRVALSGIVLTAICKYQGIKLLKYLHKWPKFLMMGFFMMALPFSFINLGEVYISSGLAAIILSTIPLFTALIANIMIKDYEPLTKRTLMGVILGAIGVTIVYLPYLQDGMPSSSFGILFIIIAAISYALAMVLARKYLQGLPSLVGPTFQILAASVLLLPISLLIDKPYEMSLPSIAPVASVFILGSMETAFAMYMLHKSIALSGATFTSLNSLVVPILAVLLGAVFLEEKLYINAYLGGAIILIALVIANPYIAKDKSS